MNEELFHQVVPLPQSSLAPIASRIESKPFVLKSKAFHRLAPDGLIYSVFLPLSAVNYQLQEGCSAPSSFPQTHIYCPSKGQRMAPSLSYMIGVFHLENPCCFSPSPKSYVNFKAPLKAGLLRKGHPNPLTCSFSAPSWSSSLVPPWWQLWVVIHWCPKSLWRGLFSLSCYASSSLVFSSLHGRQQCPAVSACLQVTLHLAPLFLIC